MEVSENFAFLKQEFPHAAESASFAERHVFRRPKGVLLPCPTRTRAPAQAHLQGRESPETSEGYQPGRLPQHPAFREIVPTVVWRKAEFVRQAGNVAVHGKRSPTPERALDVVRELYHVLYWDGPHVPAQRR